MVRNKLAMAVLALSVLQVNVAGALGLGNMSVKSALNQPLNADIKLLDMGDLDASQVKIQLGSPEEFQRASVERDFFLTNLKFNVELDGHGGGVIHIATREPVIEPYLNFVIEARWPNGRLLREFAVLLDPPTFTANRAAEAVVPAKTTGAAAKPTRVPVQPPTVTSETPAQAPTAADTSLPAAPKSGEYRIQVYDTLSKIAAKYKPAGDVSIEQTMIAIQRANPQVFIRNNVNLIKSGYVLRLPTADDVRAITATQASQEVDAQNNEWHGRGSGGRSAPAATGPQLDASAPEPTSKEGGYKEQARLSIAAPGNSDKSSVGEGSGTSGKGVEALRGQLALSQESLEKGKRDNHEMQSRLDDMERQIATLQRLISLKDDQMAALQSKPGADRAAAQQAQVPAAAGTASATTPAAPATEPTTAPVPPSTTAVAPASTPAATAPVKQAPAPVTGIAAPGLLDQLMAKPLYVGGAGALVLLLAGLAMQRRRQAAAEEREAMGDLTLDEHDNFQLDDSIDFEHAHISDDAVSAVAEPVGSGEQPRAAAPSQAVRSETGDAIAESDIYIAYGRYQQAVDLLSHAIDAEPTRSDLRVKLLEVCLEMRNKDAFRQQFLALQSLGDADAVAHAKDLLSSVDGVSDWLVDLPQTVQTSSVATAGAVAVAVAAGVAAAVVAEREAVAIPEQSFAGDSSVAIAADDELALDLDNDFEFDADLSDVAAVSATELPASMDFELPELDADLTDTELTDSEGSDFKFDLDDELDDVSPVRSVSFDLDATSIELPGESAGSASLGAEQSIDIGAGAELDLDLEHDDLDLAFGEMETGNLSDLEELSDALGSLDEVPIATTPSFDLGADLSSDLDADLSGTDLTDEFDLGNVEAELPDIERLDLAPQQAAAPSLDTASFEPTFTSDTAEATAGDEPDEFDFLADADEIATKLDLARAYIDMGDTEGAKDILDEVVQEGTDTQKQEASTLLSRIG